MDQPSKGSADAMCVQRFLEVPPPDTGGGERWALHQENLKQVARSIIHVEQSLASLRELVRSPAIALRLAEFPAAAATRPGGSGLSPPVSPGTTSPSRLKNRSAVGGNSSER